MVDPEAVLIGGGVSKAGQILLDAIVEPFQGMAFHACKGYEDSAGVPGK